VKKRRSPIIPELKSFDSADVHDPDTWAPPASAEVFYWMTLEIGEPGAPGADCWQVCVANRAGWKSRAGTAVRPRGKAQAPPIVVEPYSWSAVLAEVNERLRRSEGERWLDVQEALRREFEWEYED
jgi:hypothetical protein